MKTKKLLPVLALALAATTFAACGDKTVTFSPYWHKNALSPSETFYEQAEYTVTSKESVSNYCNYTVKYEGTFTTTLEYKPATDVYVFETNLAVKAIFTLGNTTSEVDDTMTSSVEFQAKDNFLRPIKSTKKMTCHTPLRGDYKEASQCYVIVDYEYNVEYSETENKGSILSTKYDITNSDGETTKSILNDKFNFVKDHSYIDNEQLLVAVRALDDGATLGSYNPFAENTQKVKISYTNADAAENFTYVFKSETGESSKESSILCRTAKITLYQTNPGVTHKIKMAKYDSQGNTNHCVILSITTPLSFGMGEIYYNLSKLSYHKA